jgi:two-component system, NtrC family, nitrogen regulation sensor histidine kinase NtrY
VSDPNPSVNPSEPALPEPENPVLEVRKRKRDLISIGILLTGFITLNVVEYRTLRVPGNLSFASSLAFFGLINLNLVLLATLIWLILRNVGKLFIERRSRVLGSSLKAKLVLSFLGFSILPTIFLFILSASYLNSSFDRWFSQKVQNALQASFKISEIYYNNTEKTSIHFATHLAELLEAPISKGESFDHLREFLEEQRKLLALHSVELYLTPFSKRIFVRDSSVQAGERDFVPETEPAANGAPGTNPPLLFDYPALSLDLLDRTFAGETLTQVQSVGEGDLMRSAVPVKLGKKVLGVVVINAYIPVSLKSKVSEIASISDDYRDTNPLRYPIKSIYWVLLLMITLLIIFAEIWLGLYLARQLTIPIERLAAAARQIGKGVYSDVAIERVGHDETVVLVDSFNKMTHDLRENRDRLERAQLDLERRKIQLEAILTNVNTGVVVVEQSGKVTTLNQTASQLLGIPIPEALSIEGDDLPQDLQPLVSILRKALEGSGDDGALRVQWNFLRNGELRNLLAIATPLREGRRIWGAVAAVDDLTLLAKGQREMAWREVARRIAHEIKNPLTPIKLSAQRLQRRLSTLPEADLLLLEECTNTIIQCTDDLKDLVNEFSNFARFPEITPTLQAIQPLVEEVIQLYRNSHPEVTWTLIQDPNRLVLLIDRDQIKRVLVNLLDNALNAIHETTESIPEIRVVLKFHPNYKFLSITVEDNGPGMDEEVRTRVFEPYFSTRKEGTGLGLAIVKRIVNDHNGVIRVHSQLGKGTTFVIELPIPEDEV